MKFRLFGVEISASFWFFASFLALVLADRSGMTLAWYLVLPMAIHECGHLLAMLVCGIPLKAVSCGAFGMDMRPGTSATALYAKDIALALGGAAANLVTALALHLFAFHSLRVMFFVSVNIALAMFHLMPVGDLDGGQALRLLLERYGSPETAFRVSRLFSFLLLVPLFAAAIFLVLRGFANLSLLLVCLYLAGTVIKGA